MSSRQARWQEERKQLGLCIQCGRPRPPELSSYCIGCAVKRREQRRARLGSMRRRTGAKTYQLSSPVRKPIERAKPQVKRDVRKLEEISPVRPQEFAIEGSSRRFVRRTETGARRSKPVRRISVFVFKEIETMTTAELLYALI